jgi:predicted RNA-binding protein
MNNFGLKELYDVSLKTTYPIEVKGRKIDIGETVAVFDRIQVADFIENKSFISANGGFDNRP